MSSAVIAAVREDNKLRIEDRAAHDWYRFVLSYPAHLVRDYVARLGIDSNQTVLDPFCGTGTTLVECKKLGIPSIGIESNPMTRCRFVDFESIETQLDRLQTMQLDRGVRVSGLVEGEQFSTPDQYIYPSGV